MIRKERNKRVWQKWATLGDLTLAILFAIRVLLSTEAVPFLGNMMLLARVELDPSTAFPKLE